MTTQKITLRTPDDVVRAVPLLLGFVPAESLTLVLLAGRRVRLTARVDLPHVEIGTDGGRGLVDHVLSNLAATSVVVVVHTETPGPAPYRELVMSIVGHFTDRGVEVRDALLARDGRRWSYVCDNPACCPPDGKVIDVVTPGEAQFVVQGFAMPLASRDEILVPATPISDTLLEATALRLLAELEVDRPAALHAAEASVLAVIRGTRPISDEDVAAVVVGCAPVQVRDRVIGALTANRDDADHVNARLHDVAVRGGECVSVLAVLACCWYASGMGAHATTACERALEFDPECNLARLVRATIAECIPPVTFLASIDQALAATT